MNEQSFSFAFTDIDYCWCRSKICEEVSLCYKQIWLAGLNFIQLVSVLQMKYVNSI